MFGPSFETEQWTHIDNSSLISGIGTRDDYLIIQFKNGDLYRYDELAYEYNNLLTATSVGKYFHSEIRNQETPCQKLQHEEWPEDL